jgi:hypothetical protein
MFRNLSEVPDTSPLLFSDFLDFVLAQEVGLLLICKDMGVTRAEGLEHMRRSIAFGSLHNPDLD